MTLHMNHHIVLQKGIEKLYYDEKPTFNKEDARAITIEFITYLLTNKNSALADRNQNGLHYQLMEATKKIKNNEKISDGKWENIIRYINGFKGPFFNHDDWFHGLAIRHIGCYLVIDQVPGYSTLLFPGILDATPDEMLNNIIFYITAMIEHSDCEINGNPWRDMRNELKAIIYKQQQVRRDQM